MKINNDAEYKRAIKGAIKLMNNTPIPTPIVIKELTKLDKAIKTYGKKNNLPPTSYEETLMEAIVKWSSLFLEFTEEEE